MKIKNSWIAVAMIAVLSGVVSADTVTQTTQRAPSSMPPGAVVTTEATTHATVQAIDYAKRTITLKSPSGEVSTMTVGPEVKRLNEIKVGDTIQADYMESVAINVQKATPGQTADQSSGQVAVRLKGQKPGAAMATTDQISAEVVDVDYTARTITLKGPDGNIVKLNVPDAVKRLSEIKKGDFVITQRTVAVALNVKKL